MVGWRVGADAKIVGGGGCQPVNCVGAAALAGGLTVDRERPSRIGGVANFVETTIQAVSERRPRERDGVARLLMGGQVGGGKGLGCRPTGRFGIEQLL